MAYSGFLLKIGTYIIPANKFIKAESYSAYVNMQDLDPWTDANGYLHREAVELKAEKIEFETPAMLTNTEFAVLMSNIRANFTVPKARQLSLLHISRNMTIMRHRLVTWRILPRRCIAPREVLLSIIL